MKKKKYLLLNEDGSFPNNLDPKDIMGRFVLVHPTEIPSDGFPYEEGEPEDRNGKMYQTWVQQKPDEDQVEIALIIKWENIRKERDKLLQETDWTQLNDIPQYVRDEMKEYRQKLRDITKVNTPEDIVWPEKPNIKGDWYVRERRK